MNKALKIVVVAGLILSVAAIMTSSNKARKETPRRVWRHRPWPPMPQGSGLPRLVDLGADKCIPCKMMAPILEELKEQYKGRLDVVFIDVWKNPNAGGEYGIKLIPDADLLRRRREGTLPPRRVLLQRGHPGQVEGVRGGPVGVRVQARLPSSDSPRPSPTSVRRRAICYMCDGNIDAKSLVTVQTDKGPVRLCGPHCYFIMYSCLTEDKTGFREEESRSPTGPQAKPVPISEAAFLSGEDEATGRPWIKAFAGRDAAVERASRQWRKCPGHWNRSQQKEMSHRCGFCDRACYPQDAAEVIVEGGVRTWGCCSHCALGVAARTGKDIEVHEKDRLTKQPIVVKTLEGKVASLEPATAVAWFGQRQKPDGTWASAGCFHQGFFTSADNLKKWVEQNPSETGRLISINQALADKMKLSPEQITEGLQDRRVCPEITDTNPHAEIMIMMKRKILSR